MLTPDANTFLSRKGLLQQKLCKSGAGSGTGLGGEKCCVQTRRHALSGPVHGWDVGGHGAAARRRYGKR